MSKNYYDPRNIRRMTRNANQSFLDQQRFLEKQKTRRELEEKKLQIALEQQEQASVEAAESLKIVINAMPVQAERSLAVMRDAIFSIGRLIPEGIEQAFKSMNDQPVYLQSVYLDVTKRVNGSYVVYEDGNYFGIDTARQEPSAPKPPRIEPSPFSLIEVDDEN